MAFEAGTAFVDVLPRSDAFISNLIKQLSPALRTAESGFANVGKSILGAATSAPALIGAIGLIGIASGKAAVEFQAAMDRIIGLVGVSREQVQAWQGDILDLSRTLPVAPTELANALFFITSAGQRGAEAMETLRISAEASAAGLGDTKTIADLVTSAMNAYAGSNLTAAHATDILIAAVREGKLEPAALAASLGQVLPVASQLGVSLDQVAAAIASTTRQGIDAARASTGVRFLLSSFIKPSAQAQEALASVGFSVQGLQDSIKERGLLQTLQELADRFDLTTAHGRQMFAQVVGGARGMQVAGVLVGENWRDVSQIFENVAHSTGSLDRAFETASETVEFKFGKAVSSLKAAGVEIGSALLPPLAKIADLFGVVAGQATLLFEALLLFAGLRFLPTLLISIGSALEALEVTAASNAIAGLAVVVGSLAAPVAGLTLGFGLLGSALERIHADNVVEASNAIVKFGSDSSRAAPAVAQLSREIAINNGISFRLPSTTEQREANRREIENTIAALDREHTSLQVANSDLGEFQAQLGRIPASSESARSALDDIARVALVTGQSFNDFEKGIKSAIAKAGTDVRAWPTFVQETMNKAAEAFASFRDEASTQLNFVAARFGEVANDFKGSASKIAQNLGRALTQQKQFGRDLRTIADDGTKGAKILVQQLLALGPAGARAAHTIAGASEQTRASIEASLRKGQEFANDLATSLQKQILGTLGDIRKLLSQIARSYGIKVNLEGNAKSELTALEEQLNRVVTKDWTASVRLAVHGDFPVHPTATGFHGQVSQPTLFLAGEAGSERVDITPGGPSGAGRARVRGQLAIADWHRGIATLQGELDWADALAAS